MKIINKKLTLEEFKIYISKKNFLPNAPNKCIIHHTWKPTEATWNGQTTIDALKRYYEGLGWSAGPHLFIAPDGIWLFSDMSFQGIHAGAGNYRSIGIEVVGNYDGAKWTGEIKRLAVGVIAELQKVLTLDLKLHREYNSTKTCPGLAITKEWVKEKIVEYTPKTDSLEEYLERALPSLSDTVSLEATTMPLGGMELSQDTSLTPTPSSVAPQTPQPNFWTILWDLIKTLFQKKL